MIDTSLISGSGAVNENLFNQLGKANSVDCVDRHCRDEIQCADRQDLILTTEQLRSALQAEKEKSRKKDMELQATRARLCEEIGRSNRMHTKIEKMEDNIHALTNQVEKYKEQMLQSQWS